MPKFEQIVATLPSQPKTWLVTGVAGFIGSNLLEALLNLNQKVIGLDNFFTGKQENLKDVEHAVGADRWKRFTFIDGDIRDLDTCRQAAQRADYILHQAALGSVPRSIDDPITTNQCNIDGFVNMLVAAKEAGVKRFVYAASSATYGDHPKLPKVEDEIGRPLSPYALTKYVNELYADVFHRTYGLESIGLRYFNVFGRRQDPEGAYAAVIPKWIGAFLNGNQPVINGDGKTSRDFCYIDNVVQSNLLAALSDNPDAVNQVYNVAYGARTTLNELFSLIREGLASVGAEVESVEPIYGPAREGDVRHSLADITKAKGLLGYTPQFDVKEGMKRTVEWFVGSHETKVS